MESRPGLRSLPFVVAITVAMALVLSAPFIGFVRSWIRAAFPGRFVLIVGAAIAVLALAAIVAASLRIRHHRLIRYAGIAAALAVAAAYSAVERTGNPDVDVVQQFHFVEYGVITFLFYRAWRPLEDPAIVVLPALAGVLVGTADEWLQWFIPNRVGEIADIFLNGVAIACGLVFSIGADPPSRFARRLHGGSLSTIGRLSCAALLVLAAFVQVVHLGYDVRDATAGTFKSRYSREQLLSLASAKREEWRVRPFPLVLQRVSREDQYMTEGVTHVQKRNELLAAGDAHGAWMENLILETYFAPVLDTPSYVSRSGHRWPPGQRADVQARSGTATPDYVSGANPYPIYAWPRGAFWLTCTAAAAALWLGATRWSTQPLCDVRPPFRIGS